MVDKRYLPNITNLDSKIKLRIQANRNRYNGEVATGYSKKNHKTKYSNYNTFPCILITNLLRIRRKKVYKR